MKALEINLKDVATWSDEAIRGFITQVERHLSQIEQIEIPVRHDFSQDVYARTVDLPKNSLVVGKIHKHRNLNVLLKGDVSILSVDGLLRVQAPYTVVSSPGVKRLVYAHEDSQWMTVHGTSETDVEKIEEQFIANDYDEVVSWHG